MIKFKVGDTVKITTGKDKGREGKIESIDHKNNLMIIPGLNIYKKHVKGSQGQKGGIYDIPRPFAFSKIALLCPKCKKVTRVGFRVMEKEKVRVCRKCGKEIDTK
ncbi:50S ribosomal protein L24 [Candidatus Woesebacteria bacterium RIFCSPHIGHO2_12_FULL_46_16]|uniref:Large ribosomal subunit protein uL24 n=3 Tax=Microgenomates group TaxID=1794810 RepID=A0A0H4TFY0_9BACT|nr:50S ribosomal protein L24, large subunit ribosomal protein L24 [uncultured Microgenomates bacterium Rifle_16ft_4_minimus_37906]AKQ05572.1 50S ribosomal protein L24, large subunit ribosomal protein L24 [uncultured Microgenomates bacterium Rifle_16ft_4_minimus_24682]OGM57959.1 MAG: 50S ribosomal protein L24 [Candidatus Woesebacteria bacterium RIFCSPHIGHO2_12_FULL_46_16]